MNPRSLTQLEWGGLRRLALENDCTMPVESFSSIFDNLPDQNYKYHLLWDFIVGGLIRFNEDDSTVTVTLAGLHSWLDLSVLDVTYKVFVDGTTG